MRAADHILLSKIAISDQHGENSPYFDGWKAYDNNPYHPIQNPNGVIQMGLAENQVCRISCMHARTYVPCMHIINQFFNYFVCSSFEEKI